MNLRWPLFYGFVIAGVVLLAYSPGSVQKSIGSSPVTFSVACPTHLCYDADARETPCLKVSP